MKKKYLYTSILVVLFLLAGIQPALGRKYIPSDTEIGTWDAGTRTYTLTTDVSETIEINGDNLTLDGAGYTVTGPGSWGSGVYPYSGVYLDNRAGVTIKNVNVEAFRHGILLGSSSNNTLTGNNLSNNYYCGIQLEGSSNYNTLEGNTASNNDGHGICLFYGPRYNTLAGNTINWNRGGGIYLEDSTHNTLTDNTVCNNWQGIYFAIFSHGCTLTGNTVNWNVYSGISFSNWWDMPDSDGTTVAYNTVRSNGNHGILLKRCYGYQVYNNNFIDNERYGAIVGGGSGNTLTGNTFTSNGDTGIRLNYSSNNRIYNNKFIDNGIGSIVRQAHVLGGSGNVFNLDKPIGGNYWSDWTTPDADGDGFVDEPYVLYFGIVQDNLPWARPDGWLNQPPVANAGPDQTVEQDSHAGASVTLDGSGSSDPDGDTLTYLWTWAGGSASGVNPTVLLLPGVTTITLTVSDGQLSDTDTVDVTVQDTIPPEISIVAPEPYGLYPVGDLTLDFSASDSGSGLSVLRGTLTDAVGYSGEVDSGFVPETGVYTLVVSATDEAGNYAESEPIFFVVYDPSGGFVTGGGWIWSPQDDYPYMAVEGKANFGFVSKHKKGATVPTGNTKFVFKAGDLNFHSRSYDWLVVTGSNYARFKGVGTINGYGGHRFMIWAGDNPDTFRIRIWEEDEFGVEDVVYDNGTDQMIDGGSIVIHTE